jgi:hypothetical protein
MVAQYSTDIFTRKPAKPDTSTVTQPKETPPGGPVSPGSPGGQQPGWGVNWKGDVTMPQSVQDWGRLAGEQASMGAADPLEAWMTGNTLANLRGQSEAARQRLGPFAAGSADIAGELASPANYLSMGLGPASRFAGGVIGSGLQGAVQEGVKSKMEGDDWTTAANNAIKGGVTGLVAGPASRVLTGAKTLGNAAQGLTGAAAGWGAHHLGFDPVTSSIVGLGGAAIRDIGDTVKDAVANSPGARALVQYGIRNFILGGGSTTQQQGDNDWARWAPMQ